MAYRSRTRDLRTNISGTLWYNGTLLTRTIPVGQRDTCIDYVDLWERDNPLEVTHDIRYVCRLNGTKYQLDGVTVKYQFTNYPASWVPGPYSTVSKYPVPSSAQLEEMALKAAARTNPSVPHVSVPTFLGELRDIPTMIKGWGQEFMKNYATKGAGKTNGALRARLGLSPVKGGGATPSLASHLANRILEQKFAFAPLISDLRKMCRFTEAVMQRIIWLKHLQENRCLRRRCMLETDETYVPGTSNINVQSLGGSVTAYRDVAYTKNVWATARWNLDPDVVFPAVEAQMPVQLWPGTGLHRLTPFNLAERLTYGFTTYEAVATLWELTPWSWFVDWFSGVGDWIAANNNTLPLRISNINVCRTLKSRTTYRVRPAPYSDSWITVSGPWTEVEERKERHPCANPTVLALVPSLPALNGGQLSILWSLAALKASGSRLPGIQAIKVRGVLSS